MKENKSRLSQTEYEKYEKQHELCKEVVSKYDAPNFDEKNEAQSREIMDLMQKVRKKGRRHKNIIITNKISMGKLNIFYNFPTEHYNYYYY